MARVATVLLIVSAYAFANQVLAETALLRDAISQNAPSREVLLDNDKVLAVRLTYPPGTESGVHNHEYAFRSVYFLNGGTLNLVAPDGTSKTVTGATGDLLFMPAVTHNIQNIGDTTVVLLEQELK